MTDASAIVTDIAGFINSRGQLVRIRRYTPTFTGGGSYYDDDVTLARAGTDQWISGLPQPINKPMGSSEYQLIEQGKLLMSDKRLYLAGSIGTSGIIKIGLGSPAPVEYSILPEGVIDWEVNNQVVLKKVYVRVLNNGSFIGET